MTLRLILAGIVCALATLATAQTVQQQADAAIDAAEWYERNVANGVVARSYQFDDLFGSGQVLFVYEADMANANVGFEFAFLDGGSRNTVSGFAAGIANSVAGINGNFFSSSGSVQYLKVNGTLINATVNAQTADQGGVVIDASDNLRAIERPGAGWASLADPNIMATNIPLVLSGAAFPFPNIAFYQTDRHPRTAVGTTPDGKALLVVADGRSSIAAGMTFVELAAVMLALGADEAVNMDGGGSSTFWDTDLPGNGVGNIPSDGAQRTVANAIFATSTVPAPTPLTYDAYRAPTSSNASPYAPVSNTVVSQTQQEVSFSFVNSGTATWTPSTVFLATSEPVLHASSLYTAGDWIDTMHATALDNASVAPGATGTFTFTLTAPMVAMATNIHESFVLVEATETPFGPRQNRAYLTVVPPSAEGEIVLESRQGDGSLTPAPTYVETGPFSNTTSKSTVTLPPVVAPGARYNFTIGSTATFSPMIETAGLYDVFVTLGAGSNNNAFCHWEIGNADADVSGSISLSFTDTATLVNKWKVLAQDVRFEAGGTAYVKFTNQDGDNASGKRFVMDAVRFELVKADGATTDALVTK